MLAEVFMLRLEAAARRLHDLIPAHAGFVPLDPAVRVEFRNGLGNRRPSRG